MKCAACGKDNLPGTDICEACYSSLAGFEVTSASPGYLRAEILKDPIKKVGLREATILPPSATAREAVRNMKEKTHGCVLVVENGELAGICTERDVMRKLSFPDANLDEILVENLMTPVPEVLAETDQISHALNKMAVGNYRHVPIRRENGTFTYLSVRDALRYLF